MLHAGPMEPVLRTPEHRGPEPFKSEHGDDMDYKGILIDYRISFALNALLERYGDVPTPRDEHELRTLLVDFYHRLNDAEERRKQQLLDTEPPTAADVFLLQIMHQVFDQHPEWLDRRNNNQPPAALAPTVDDETSSVASSASSSNPPSTASSRQRQSRPFKCTVCGKEFGYKHVLQNHERTHTGEKPFVCSVCKKCFTRDHHLKTHVRLHTGEKPFWCPHCNRFFVQVANLRRHLKTHTGESSHPCEYCVAFFETATELKDHKRQHKENNKPRGGVGAKPAQKRRRGNKDATVAEQTELSAPTTPWAPVAHGSPPPSPLPSVPASYWSSPPPQPQAVYVQKPQPPAVSPPAAAVSSMEPYHYLRFIAQLRSAERKEILDKNFQSPVQTEPEDLSLKSALKSKKLIVRTAEHPVDIAMDLTCK